MRFASIGSPAGSRSTISDRHRKRAGFTLLEALVALAVVVIFAAALRPVLFHARQIMSNAEGRLAAHALLRSLLDDPLRRPSLASPVQEGETGSLQWQLVAEPIILDAQPATDSPDWIPFRVKAAVVWAPRQFVSGETVRLGRAK
jgi:prepilin-type N-terminal cleavage/methylation domain-containing protein